MKFTEAMAALQAAGTAQNRKVYARHGVQEPCFGVSYANLGKLQKKVGRDTALAERLWKSGNHDARVLATLVADPEELSAKTIDSWARDLDSYVNTDALVKVVAGSRFARKRAEKWSQSKKEWLGAAGWGLVAYVAGSKEDLGDDYFIEYLDQIENKIHSSPNRVRYAMNNAIISIGTRNSKLQKAATAVAKRVGKVEVDHGETGCKTPDAADYIRKVVEYRKKKVATARS